MKQKNDLRAVLSQLTAENRRALRRMTRYFDSYSLNEVAQEELLVDLAGMALECQQRGQAFSEAIGMDEVVFCHELVVNCPRETWAERTLGALRWMVAWIGCILPVMYFLEWVFPWMSGNIENGMYLVPMPFLCKYCAAVIPIAAGLYIFKRLTYFPRSMVWTLFAMVFLAVFITVSEVSVRLMQAITVPLSLLAWLLVFGGAFAFLHIAKRCVALTVAYRRRKQEKD